MSVTQTFDLNLIPEQAPVVVHCDQYDKGTGRLIIKLYEGDVAYAPSGTVTIQGCKPDGHGFSYAATLSGNTVTANLTEQMSCVAGHVRCQIIVTETTGRTGTFVFILDVQRSALPADVDMSESEYQFIQEAIEDCQQAVTDAEAWAVGERGGVPVSAGDPTYDNNSKYWADQAAQYAQGGIIYKGSVAFANIPTTGMSNGDMYNITDDFTTDSRFVEGSGKFCPAGTNIAWESSVSKWDVLAAQKAQSLDDLTDVSVISPIQGGQYIGYNPVAQEFENLDLPDMSNMSKGIGRPDGITTEVNLGVFSAIGVAIPAEVNTGATQYGAQWLYYAGTTTVITPDADQNYRVTDNGTTKLYFWNGSAYEVLSGGGGGGGMDTDGHNAASNVGFTGTKVFTVGDRTGKSATGTEAIELGSGGNATGFGAYAEGAKCFNANASSTSIAANLTTETYITGLSLTTYPYQCFSLIGTVATESNIEVYVDGGLGQDETITNGNVTVRITQDGTNIKVYATNTDNTAGSLYYGYNTRQNTASGSYSHVEGVANTASGFASHAEGVRNTASGKYSHVEGLLSMATNDYSHAEGLNTRANAIYSHAEGNGTVAGAYGAHTEGFSTKASSNYQHVSGKYNIEDSSNVYAVIVGNGTAENARSNAMSLKWDGDLETAGDVKNGNGMSLDNIGSGLASISATGSTNTTGSTITAGTYFYLDGVLVRALADIASGATFTQNTNYEVVTAGALNKPKMILLGSITGSETITIPSTINRVTIDIFVFHPSYPTYADNLASLHITKEEINTNTQDNWVLRAYWALSGNVNDNRVVELFYKRSTGVLSINSCVISSGTSNKNNCKAFVYIE